MKNYFATKRGNAGIGERIREEIKTAPDGVTSGGMEAVADWALTRYDTRVRAKLARLGIDVPEGEPFTVAVISERIKQASELDIQDLSKEGIMNAVDQALARTLSKELGAEVSTVFNGEVLKQEVKAALLVKLQDGSAVNFISKKLIRQLRRARTAKNAGVTSAEADKIANRAYQKKYRRKCEQIWE